jgi:hypothetical protein
MALLLDITRDARYGARLLLRNPGSSAVAIVTLALGVGVTSAVFRRPIGLARRRRERGLVTAPRAIAEG